MKNHQAWLALPYPIVNADVLRGEPIKGQLSAVVQNKTASKNLTSSVGIAGFLMFNDSQEVTAFREGTSNVQEDYCSYMFLPPCVFDVVDQV